jgi:hypothetical protein
MFVSRREARSQVRHGRQGGGSVKPYHCRHCGGWHLGHRRRRTGHSG